MISSYAASMSSALRLVVRDTVTEIVIAGAISSDAWSRTGGRTVDKWKARL